jgi:hypothetical protein
VPCVQKRVFRRDCSVQAYQQGRVRTIPDDLVLSTDPRPSHKRLTQQKKQRERERKDLETLGRKHLANVRVVQRNVVYIVGMGPRFAKEEVRL